MKDISALFEIFPICQKLLLNSIDLHNVHFTKTQMSILMTLSAKDSLNMSQAASYIASSKEQATRAVAPLVKQGYVKRYHNDSNRKKVFISLTPLGRDFIQQEKIQVKTNLASQFQSLSDADRELFQQSIKNILQILKKLEVSNES